MTDERLGESLLRVVASLPLGAGVVFRHYSLAPQARGALAQEVARTCADNGLVLAIAGDEELARTLGAHLVHNPTRVTALPFSRSVHSVTEAVAARTAGASLVFVSPVHPTRSHPGAPALGPAEALRVATEAAIPAVALGGMDERRFDELPPGAFHGWAAIDAWLSPAR